MAACDRFAVDTVFRVSASRVLIKGTAQDCASLHVAAVFPGDVRTGGLADLQPGATPNDTSWSILVDLPGGVPSSWCKSAEVSVGGICYAADGRQICESATQTKVIACCAQVSNLGPQEGSCRRRPGSGGALDRDVQWKLRIDWPSDVPDGTEISVTVELTSVEDPTYSEFQSVQPAFPETEQITPPFHLPSGSSWTGRIYITLPSFCTHTIDMPVYVVPACDAVACPLPPAGDVFLTVRDSAAAVVADPNDTGCVSGDFITVTAQPWPGTLTWRAEVNSQTLNTTATGNPREVRIEMPPGDDRVTVTAQVVVDAPSGCIHSRSVTAKRCDCTPVPAGYALRVLDEQGNTVAEGACVNGAFVDIVAPEHQGPVSWEVDGQPRSTEPPDGRTLRVALNDDNTHTVTATVGRDHCRTQAPPRTVTRCQPGVPTWKDSFWPKIPWCLILMFAGLVSLLVGMLLFTIGVAAVASVVCWFWLASALIETVIGPWIVFVVWLILAVGGIVLGAILFILGVILLIAWLLMCGGCDGLKSPVSFCEMLRLLLKALQVLAVVFGILETITLGASFVGAVICGVGWASFMAVIDAVMWLVDIGFLTFLIFGVEYFGNALGCFNTAPTLWPFSLLQIHLSPPGSNNLPCVDADAQLK